LSQLTELLGRMQAGDAGAREFGGDVGVEGLDHGEDDADGVDAGPGLGAVVEEAEFNGEGIRLLALRDEEIDAAGVVVEAAAIVRGYSAVEALSGEADLEDALRFVVLYERGAHDFGEIAVRAAARGVHLPEAVLSGDEALRDEEIVFGGGFDMRNTVSVAADCHGRGEAG